jgi:hypothetical protein
MHLSAEPLAELLCRSRLLRVGRLLGIRGLLG